jgi:hypothetical protein
MGPYAGVDFNLTLWPLQSRLQHNFYGQPYARVDLNPICQSRLYPPDRDFGFGIRLSYLSFTFPASTISIKFPKNENRILNCYAKNLLIYLLVLRCNIFYPNFGFLLQCLLLIPQNHTAVQ